MKLKPGECQFCHLFRGHASHCGMFVDKVGVTYATIEAEQAERKKMQSDVRYTYGMMGYR
jgi:hypothetical protein